MAWIMDTYSMHVRHTQTAVVTGKPISLGGSRGRAEATGRGCMIVTDQALQRLGLDRSSTRVVIQGLGNVGGMAAKLMARAGYKIICAIEYDGAVYNKNGLDITALMSTAMTPDRLPVFRAARPMIATKRCTWKPTSCCRPPRKISSPLRTRIASARRFFAKAPTAHDAAADPILAEKRSLRNSGHSRQRRRRHRFLFRMGAGSPGLFLERAAGQRTS